MAMGWLKGLVAPQAFPDPSQQQQGMPMQQPGGPPIGGMMPPQGGAPYGMQPGMQSMQPGMMQPGMMQPGMMQPGMQGMQPGLQPGMMQGMQPGMAPAVPYDPNAGAGVPGAMQWSTGTRTQGSTQGISGGGISGGGISGGGISGGGISGGATVPDGGAASLEARCAQLQHDVDSLALFARTLLTMLEEAKIVTREQFDATKNRLDMLDGKLDDR
jgi:hypothetical protein